MNAIDSVLDGLIDYAGLYPPASQDMRSTVRNYLSYRNGEHATTLGRLIVDLNRLDELYEAAGNSLGDLRLSVIVSPHADLDSLQRLRNDGFPIEMIEAKAAHAAEIERISQCVPDGVTIYIEVPVQSDATNLLDAISAAGVRAKLRLGGIVADAFPTTQAIAHMLKALARRGIPFKATAGLHHPIRSRRALTYEPGSPVGTMHGFFNLCCAAVLLHFGGEAREAKILLDEQDAAAWQVTADEIGWRSFRWSADQLRVVRQQFFISFGSCSFKEPIDDLEALGWL